MFASLKLTSIILMVLICLVSVNSAKKVRFKMGPSGMSFSDTTNCSEFSKFGRFNPYSVLHEKWFVFYYWAPPKTPTTYIFTFPTANHTKYLKKILNENTILPVMWNARQILMEDHKKETSLLVERGDRGEYWLYPLYKVTGNHKITPRDIRLKQTGDNRILGLMDCVEETLLVMARINDVPPQNRLQEEASRLGYRGRRGKSYLYQGHEWVPIPEEDEKIFWGYKKEHKDSKRSPNTEQSSEEIKLEPTKEPEDSKKKKRSNADRQASTSPNEEELQSRCIKIEPELWDDPKPNPSKDSENQLLSIEELDSLSNTTSIDAPDSSPDNKQENNKQENDKQENNLAKESENTQEDNKIENHQGLSPMPMPLSDKLESNTQLDEENCDVCYESSHYIKSTSEPYRPENTHSYKNLRNDEPPRTDVPAEPVAPQDSNSSDIEIFTIMAPQSLDDLS